MRKTLYITLKERQALESSSSKPLSLSPLLKQKRKRKNEPFENQQAPLPITVQNPHKSSRNKPSENPFWSFQFIHPKKMEKASKHSTNSVRIKNHRFQTQQTNNLPQETQNHPQNLRTNVKSKEGSFCIPAVDVQMDKYSGAECRYG